MSISRIQGTAIVPVRLWILAALAALILASSIAHGQEEYSGEFVVRSASSELIDGFYHVDAKFDLRLSSEATDMLQARLPLTIRIEVQFLNRLRLWWDPAQFEETVSYQIQYLAVPRQYLVRNVDSDERHSFATLRGALDYIGKLDSLPIVDESELDDDRRYEVRVRAVLDKRDLPGAWRLIAFWRKDWSIGSDWWSWRLDSE